MIPFLGEVTLIVTLGLIAGGVVFSWLTPRKISRNPAESM
jgi:hypothetical protein